MAKKEQPVKAEINNVIEEAHKFNFILQVVNPFGVYQKGALIIKDEDIQAVIDNGDMPNCNRLNRPN